MSLETKRPTVEAAEEILGGYFPALDHGFVALVAYMGTDEDVERAARVSYGAGTRKVSLTRGLIRYLRRHRHTTPSEMVEFKFHCAMPMFIARQWVRHRSASINEYSGRYSLMPLLFYTPEEEHFALQSESNKQGREHLASLDIYKSAVERWEKIRSDVGEGYAWMIGEDIAREIARIDLPLSTYTQWYWKIDLHNLLHFLSLRADPHAQWEIRVFANIIAGMVKRVAPLSFEAWVDYDLLGERMSRAELSVLAGLLDTDIGSVSAKPGASFSSEELKECGLSGREIQEFLGKLHRPSTEDFELDLLAMRKAEDVQAEMHEAVPGDFE